MLVCQIAFQDSPALFAYNNLPAAVSARFRKFFPFGESGILALMFGVECPFIFVLGLVHQVVVNPDSTSHIHNSALSGQIQDKNRINVTESVAFMLARAQQTRGLDSGCDSL
jgi:hypothetical protein